jgi:dipeptidyl aminopeptidase/acylaminoacyl peptidase
MLKDLRGTPEHQTVQTLYEALWQPGTQTLNGAHDLQVIGDDVYFIGTSAGDSLLESHRQAIYKLGSDGAPRMVWPGARMCQITAEMGLAACVYRCQGGESDQQVRLHSLHGSADRAAWNADGAVEALRWSPDGTRLLILVAGRAADVAGIAGGFAMRGQHQCETWLPEIASPGGDGRWRSLWVWFPGDDAPRRLTQPPCNPWEMAWCGDGSALAVASADHGEGSWYASRLLKVSLDGETSTLRTPHDQLGIPCATPSGRRIAWIEAVCSDRGLVCGTVFVSLDSGEPIELPLQHIEATDLKWRDESTLLISGLRDFETVVCELDVLSGTQRNLWASATQTLSGWMPQAVPLGSDGALAVVESYRQPPALVEFRPGQVQVKLILGPTRMPDVGGMSPVSWQAPDGLEIQGWLLLPPAAASRPARGWPLLVDVHGGPISSHRPRWATTLRADPVLVQNGWAVLLPNPRGSIGRGQDFARQVVGDMGGADLQDILAGIEQLVAQGIVDPSRVAVTGASYGGFMSCWMATQTSRLAATVPISPVSNWISQHFESQIPWFDAAFLKGEPRNANGPYFHRSAVLHAHKVRTPTLLMAGGRDKNTPPGQAVEFFSALVEAGTPCALAVYPEDGHSLRGMPAYLDSAARVVRWLSQHVGMPGTN